MRLNPFIFQYYSPIVNREGSLGPFNRWKALLEDMQGGDKLDEEVRKHRSIFIYGKSQWHPLNCYKTMVF